MACIRTVTDKQGRVHTITIADESQMPEMSSPEYTDLKTPAGIDPLK